MSTRRQTRNALLVALATSALWSCEFATDLDPIDVSTRALLFGQAFIDINGNGTADASDSLLRSVDIVLSTPTTVVRRVTTDTLGIWTMNDIPLGTYALGVDTAVLSDTLVQLGATSSLTLEAGDTIQYVLGATYPTLTLAEVRAAAAGRRVFTQGIALNSRVSNGDGVVHFQETGSYLRATGVQPVTVNPGDSVRILGRTGSSVGLPIIDNVTTFVLRPMAAFLAPQVVSIAAADTASGGTLDAALVRIGPANIGDTTWIGPVGTGTLRFWAFSGGDSVRVLLRDYLSITPNPAIRPDTIVGLAQLTGLLVPYLDASGTRWQLQPRGGADVVTETKQANLAVDVNFVPSTPASLNDTVEIVVTVRNLANNPGGGIVSTHTATGVQVADTVPAQLTFLSSTATRGSYSAASGLWTVGNLVPGGATDTLRIRVRADNTGIAVNTATLAPLVFEQENGAGNNSVTRNLSIP